MGGGKSPPVPPTRADLRSAPFARNYALVSRDPTLEGVAAIEAAVRGLAAFRR